MKRFSEWLRRGPQLDDEKLGQAIKNVFGGGEGRLVWDYLLETYYFSVCDTNEACDLAAHNGARALVQNLMEKFDRAANPKRYEINLKTEAE